MREDYNVEISKLFHMTFVSIFSALSILLIGVSIVSDWNLWVIPIAIVAILSCWLFHIFNIFSDKTRIYVYLFYTTLELIFYGSHFKALTDVPVVLCLLIICLSAYGEIKLLYISELSFVVLLIYHIFITRELSFASEQIVIARIVLGLMCLACATALSRFFITVKNNERNDVKELEKKYIGLKKESENFLNNVSHELRTPINAVNGISEILLQKDLDDEIKTEILAINHAGKRIFNQVSNILDYSEITTGNILVNQNNYEILSVVNDAITSLMWKENEKKIEIIFDISADVPAKLYGDETKVCKIITALLDNSIKFTESGGVYLFVSKRDEGYGINLNIDVYDTGIGMDEEFIRKHYKRFYKEDSGYDRKTGGLGVGLAIVHSLVSAMNGFMTIESTVGKGTHVHVSIPQGVKNKLSSITLDRNNTYNIACYFNKQKYVKLEVADYFSSVVNHIREGLQLNVMEANSLNDLKLMIEENNLTHVFIAKWEYDMDKPYFDELSHNINVAIFTDEDDIVSQGSNVHILVKPVYILSIVNYLNDSLNGSVNPTAKINEKYSKVRALVVDDDSMNIVVAKGILNTFGIEVITAQSGARAIERCMIEDYDIIFMDHMMPEMDGIEAKDKIREVRGGRYNSVPIVALTANAGSGARTMFLNAGFDEFIAKPIEISTMAKILRKMIGGRSNG